MKSSNDNRSLLSHNMSWQTESESSNALLHGDDVRSFVSTSEYGFGLDQISVSTIVEKLVAERLKLGIVKTAKGIDQQQPVNTSVTAEEHASSHADEISSLEICLDKFDKRYIDAFKHLELDGEEPEENPLSVIEPYFTSSDESEEYAEYKDPQKDEHMMLNRTRSFYSPRGFKDSRPEIKRLDVERGKMWTQSGGDRYTFFVYEEATKHLKQVKLKSRYDDSDTVLEEELDKDDFINKSLESLLMLVKPKELDPGDWEPGKLAEERFPPHWAMVPPDGTDKTINTIRYVYQNLKDVDFTKMDVKMRRRTGRRIKVQEESSDESEEEGPAKVEEVESEDEPYLLKRKDSSFIKKKEIEQIEEVEEIFEAAVCAAAHNIQQGHELSISNLQKHYPDTPESSSEEDVSIQTQAPPELVSARSYSTKSAVSASSYATTRTRPSILTERSSWVASVDLDEMTSSEESLFASEVEEHQPEENEAPILLANWKGFPIIKQRPKWITLQRDCLERQTRDQSQVESYRCLCNSRGIPPLETVARSLKKTSAIFNRMGQGPNSTIQTLAEVLNKKTKTLDLSGTYVNKTDICYIGAALQRLDALKKLILARTQLTGDMVVTLAKNLFPCESLCLLDLSYNNLHKITSDTMRKLPPSMKTLKLCHCWLAHDSFPALNALSPDITSLDISWNRFNEVTGLKNFLNSLIKHSSNLKELRISWNSLQGADTAKIIVEMGKTLPKLTYLDISYNGYGLLPEVVLFRDLLLNTTTLRVLLLAGNPFCTGSDEALLKELTWPGKPSLRLVDLGDFWINKPIFLMCRQYKADYDIEIKVGGIKGNIDLTDMDMSTIYMKRIKFLNTPKKKKKNAKDLGNTIKKLLDKELEDGGGPRVRASKLRAAMEEDKLKLEEGLAESFIKYVQDHRMIDLEKLLAKYRALYPEEIKPEKKKKVPKKRKEDHEEPVIEIMEPKLEMVPSQPNVSFIEAENDVFSPKLIP